MPISILHIPMQFPMLTAVMIDVTVQIAEYLLGYMLRKLTHD
jgi:hypothetical protein